MEKRNITGTDRTPKNGVKTAADIDATIKSAEFTPPADRGTGKSQSGQPDESVRRDK